MSLKFNIDDTFEFEKLTDLEWISLGGNKYHCLKNGKKYVAELKEISNDGKQLEIRIAGHNYQIKIQEELDQLIDKMGLNDISAGKLSSVHAPMPGMVLDVLVQAGQTIEPGADLLVLEAMKMENVIQADGSGVVANVVIKKGAAVDKGQLLIEME